MAVCFVGFVAYAVYTNGDHFNRAAMPVLMSCVVANIAARRKEGTFVSNTPESNYNANGTIQCVIGLGLGLGLAVSVAKDRSLGATMTVVGEVIGIGLAVLTSFFAIGLSEADDLQSASPFMLALDTGTGMVRRVVLRLHKVRLLLLGAAFAATLGYIVVLVVEHQARLVVLIVFGIGALGYAGLEVVRTRYLKTAAMRQATALMEAGP